MVKKLLWQLGPLVALFVIMLLFTVADSIWGEGYFMSARNLRVISSSAALIAVPAFGMTLIIISGGIDLSAGTALTLSGTALALSLKAGDPIINALMLMLLTGCLCGFANGVMISATKVVPFIVTLGTMTIFLGIGQIISGESTVYAPKVGVPILIQDLTASAYSAEHHPAPAHGAQSAQPQQHASFLACTSSSTSRSPHRGTRP